MGFGRYRFRRSFGNVSSQFRGARFDTYPLNPYPLAGRVLDLSNFDYSLSEVPDISGEGNNAVLYSARGINLAGSGYAELPNVGATKSITVLARSSTDTTLYATDDATQTEDASVTLVANDTWQEVTLTFTSAISGAIRLGTNGTNFFSGDLADAVCKDASGSTLDQFYLNEHTDTSFEGLDGLPLVGRNGSVGQYVDAAAVVQIPGDVGGLTPPQVLGMNFNRYSAITPTPILDPDGDILVPASLSNSSLDALGNAMDLRERDEFNFDGSGYAVVPYDESLDVTDEFSVVIDSFDFDPTTDIERLIGRYDSPNGERIWALFANNPSTPSSGFSVNFGDPNNGSFEGRYDFPLTIAGNYKLAFVYDGTLPAGERLKLYTQDGEQSGSLGNGIVPASLAQFDQDLVIGANPDGSDQLATTRAGGIRYYNLALTAEEAATFL